MLSAGSRQVTSLRAAGLLTGVKSPSGQTAAVEDRNGIQHSVEASMPESMALVKLKGFIYDLGGEVVESVPGLIRVRLPDAQGAGARKSAGLFGWFDKGNTAVQSAGGTDIELRMERKNPALPSRLTITLVMRPVFGNDDRRLADAVQEDRAGSWGVSDGVTSAVYAV